MKILHECHIIPYIRFMKDVKFEGDTHFCIWPKLRSTSSPGQGKLGRSMELSIFFQKYTYLVRFCLRIPKMRLILMRPTKTCQKSHLKQVTS